VPLLETGGNTHDVLRVDVGNVGDMEVDDEHGGKGRTWRKWRWKEGAVTTYVIRGG